MERVRLCRSCGIKKKPSEFSRESKSKDGLRWKCRDCCREYHERYYAENSDRCKATSKSWRASNPERNAAITAKWRAENPDAIKAAVRRYRIAHPEQLREYRENWRRDNPEKAEAQRVVNVAIRRGDLVRQPCEVCGAEKVHAHHDSYDPGKRLDVRWLCPTHHSAHHAKVAS